VQIALSGSLSLLWGMVNTLQIIIQMPLVNLSMPPNAMLLSKSLVSMASFDFIPVNSINVMAIFHFKSDQEEELRYIEVGMETKNFILNCGTMLWAIFFWFFMVLIYYLVKILSKCFKKLEKVKIKLGEIIFFGMLVVLLLESYLEVIIAAFL